jgi:hypothetical protein
MQSVRRLVETFAKEMQNAPRLWSEKAEQLAGEVGRLAAGTPLAQRHAAFVASLRRGDSVYVIPFKRDGVVERIRRKRGTIVLFVDSKQVEVTLAEICRSEGARP